MSDFIIGEEVWLLRNRRPFVRSTSECINLCIYRGKDEHTISVQYIIDGKLGMTSSIGSSEGLLFKTLEELKTHLINDLKVKMTIAKQEYQKKIDSINVDIDYIQSLKDIKEDREKKLNELGI